MVEGNKPIRRVIFIGGLEDGRMALEVLKNHPGMALVGVFVLDEEAGKHVSGFRTFDDLVTPPVLRKIKQIKDQAASIQELQPDLIIIIGFSQIIPKAILDIPPLGVIGFHSAVLPGRRGCSPIIWAMIDGLKETGVTMFYMDEGIDTGDVIGVEKFFIEEDDGATEVLKKADKATITLLSRYLEPLLNGVAPRIKQDLSSCSYTRKRTPADGEIDWSKPAHEIMRLIRALSPPYPMAHTFGGDGVAIFIEKARLAQGVKLPPSRYVKPQPRSQKVLCIACHPDDEVLGVGGTLALHANRGDDVLALILSEGENEKFQDTPRCATRRECAFKAAEILGIRVICKNLPDQRLDSVPFIELIKVVESAIEQFQPNVIYTHHRGDANTDHQLAFKAVYASCRPMSALSASVERFLTFETPSSTEQAPQIGDYVFNPNLFVDIESVWEKKINALKCYPMEMIGGKHPRSFEYIEALARVRGGYSGYSLAEAFVSIRERISLH
jgi:methionyl-tRNA formyltransferase